ncbi:MAG TPA: exodeoxyribonuclease VII small subunit [Candidatus Saccharimonadales bacterium]|nr:exodeoxyribonuclease VII small subunit [Candidatus Saccharimonadales bacterium]
MSKNLNDQFKELDELLAWFERPDLDVEEALAKFEEGVKLTDEIKKRISEAENKITILKEKFAE